MLAIPAGSAARGQVIHAQKASAFGKLRNGWFFALPVEPGAHVYKVHSETKDLSNLEVAAGETHFVRAGVSMGVLAGHPNLSPSTPEEFDEVHKTLKPAKPLK